MTAREADNKLHLRMAMNTTVKFANKTVELERCLQRWCLPRALDPCCLTTSQHTWVFLYTLIVF